MKRILFFITLALGLSAQAQSPHLESIPGRLDMLYIHGNCSLDILRADRLALAYEHSFPFGESPFYQSGSRLIINDTSTAHYTLYYDRDTLPQLLLTLPGSKARIQTQGVVIAETKDIDQFYASTSSQPAEAKVTQDTARQFNLLDDIFPRRNKEYTFADRLRLSLHWGLSNWGSEPINGFTHQFADPAYQLRTSAGSLQLAAAYSVVLRDRFRLALGLGWERARNSFVAPYVIEHAFGGGNVATGESWHEHYLVASQRPEESYAYPEADHFSTYCRFSYLTLPVTVAFSPRPHLELGLTALPGTMRREQLNHNAIDANGNVCGSISDWLGYSNSFKFDMRLELSYRNLGLFLQWATVPLYTDTRGTRLYPVKAGLSFSI